MCVDIHIMLSNPCFDISLTATQKAESTLQQVHCVQTKAAATECLQELSHEETLQGQERFNICH